MIIEFKKTVEDNLNAYTFKLDNDEKLIKNNWPGLMKYVGSNEFDKLYDALCIKANENCEEVPIYLTLIWNLISHLNVYAIPTYYSYEVIKKLNIDHDVIKWEYNMINSDGIYQDNDFIRAESSSQRNTNLIKISSLEDLIDVQKILINCYDTHTEVNLFCLTSNEFKEDLINKLKSEQRPSLNNLLSIGDIFVDFIIGTDLGYNDSIAIKSKDDLSTKLNNLANQYNKRIKKYENENKSIKTIDEFILYFRELFITYID